VNNNKKVLAIILARSGSKGLPGKNIKMLCGKPLMNHSIDLALSSKLIDKTVVSTDSKKYAQIAKTAGAEAPFLRPAYLSGSLVVEQPVMRHILQWYAENENYRPDIIVYLRPTAPLRTLEETEEAIKLLSSHPESDSVISVKEAETPYKMWKSKGEYIEPFIKEYKDIKEPYNAPRQLLPVVYMSTPDIAVFWARTLLEKDSILGTKILPIYLERQTIDIDNLFDFKMAEYLLKHG